MTSDKLTDAMRKAKPTLLRVFCHDRPEPVVVKIPNTRSRWTRAIEVLESLPWTRIEMTDNGGALLAVYEGEERAPVKSEAEEESHAAPMSPEERWLGLMVKAQRLSLEQQNAAMQPLIDGYTRLASMLSDRLAGMERSYAQMLNTLREAVYSSALAEAREDAADAAPSGLGELAAHVAKGLVGPSAAPTNGAR